MAAEERRGLVGRLLRTPLLTKIVLVDLVVDAIVFVVTQRTPPALQQEVTLLSLGIVLLLNAGLVAWALHPLAILEETARRVSAGEFTARTVMPPFTDRNLARIGDTLNALLDRVDTDRRRLRTLATEVVAAGDRERSHIARELHDGTAQSLSALDMLLASAQADPATLAPGAGNRLALMRDVVSDALAEVRALSHSVHPRVLDDLGLPAALATLARRTRAHAGVEVALDVTGERELPPAIAAALYRVVQEAVHNAVKHGKPGTIRVAVRLGADFAEVTIRDDGVGFDRAAAGHRGMGLFVMEERAALVGGSCVVDTQPGAGTTVEVHIPLTEAA